MIRFKKLQKKKMISYLSKLFKIQEDSEYIDTFVYSSVTMYQALKHNVIIPSFMMHPEVVKVRMFYQQTELVKDKKELIDLIARVLEYEIMEEKNYMPEDERNELIKAHKRLTKKK